MVRVRLVQPMAGAFQYWGPGDFYEARDEQQAQQMIAAGLAERVATPESGQRDLRAETAVKDRARAR